MDDSKRSSAATSATTPLGAGLSDFVIESLMAHRPMTSAAKFQFRCPACGHSLRAQPAMAGRSAKCPACSITFRIPNRPVPGWLRE